MSEAHKEVAEDASSATAGAEAGDAKTRQRPRRKPAANKASRRKTRGDPAAATPQTEKKVAAPLLLSARLGIQNVAELQEQMADILQAEGAVSVDAAKVESVDIAALQLIVAFANTVRAQARPFVWQGSNDTLLGFARLADLDQHLHGDTTAAEADDDGLCPVF